MEIKVDIAARSVRDIGAHVRKRLEDNGLGMVYAMGGVKVILDRWERRGPVYRVEKAG